MTEMPNLQQQWQGKNFQRQISDRKVYTEEHLLNSRLLYSHLLINLFFTWRHFPQFNTMLFDL